MEDKYKLTDLALDWKGHTLHRIIALKDFGNVRKGDIGGWVESKKNLSQEGDCWVYDNAKVCGNAEVGDNAKIFNNATIKDRARVWGEARVMGKATIRCAADVFGNACIYDNAVISGNAMVFDRADIRGKAEVLEQAIVAGDVMVKDNARVGGCAHLSGSARVFNNAYINDCCISDPVHICQDVKIRDIRDFIIFKNWWGSGRYFIWTRSNNMWSVGCFYGTGEELIKKAYKDSEKSGREYERVVKYVENILKEENYEKQEKRLFRS